MHHIHLPHPLRTVREHLHPAGRTLLRTLRPARLIPLCPALRRRKQHLHANRAHHAHRAALKDRHPADRIRIPKPPSRYDHCPSRPLSSHSTATPDPDDSAHHDYRPAAPAIRLRSRSRRQPGTRSRSRRRHAHRHSSTAPHRTRILYPVQENRRTNNAPTRKPNTT